MLTRTSALIGLLASAVVVLSISLWQVTRDAGGSPKAGEQMLADINREYQTLNIKFHAFDSVEALHGAIERAGFEVSPSGYVGFAAWSLDDMRCHVFYLRPEHVDDNRMTTLGHEVAHCLYGDFHD